MNVDKIIVTKNIIRFENFVCQFSSEEELRITINNIFMNNLYGEIHVYKRCPGSGKPAIKSCIFYDDTSEKNAVIISDKQHVPAIKEELKELGLTYSKPNGGKNKKLLNNSK